VDLNSTIGPIAAIITAIGTLPLANLAQRGRENRLRNAIKSNLSTIVELDKAAPGNASLLHEKLEGVLEKQFDSLAQLELETLEKKLRNWPSLAASIILAALVSTPMWFMWMPLQWYTWTVFVALAGIAVLLIVSGINACFSQELNQKRLAKARGADANT
jgi:hypothetical protein